MIIRPKRAPTFPRLPYTVWEPTKDAKGNPTRYGSKHRRSKFHPHLARSILGFYCPKGGRVFDPFSGDGTRKEITEAMGMLYEGEVLLLYLVLALANLKSHSGREFLPLPI